MRELDQNFCFYLSFIIAASKTLRFSLFSEIATVTTAYNAVTADQLSLSPGQLILVKRKHPDGWWEGELQVMSCRLSIRGCTCISHTRSSLDWQAFSLLISTYHIFWLCASSKGRRWTCPSDIYFYYNKPRSTTIKNAFI